MRRIGIAAAAAAGLSAVTLVGLAGGASAAAPTDSSNSWIKAPATSYTSPSNQSIRVHTLHPGEQVQSLCFTEGQELHGNFYWFRILKGGEQGYVHRDAIVAPPDLRNCVPPG